jgi:DNA-directed RNA polymerase specialized sigma24 family protein
MRSPETFDAYYVETRTRLLHEAFALTGDAPAARAAVRDAFVVAWHHWRKVGQLDDRDAYVRPIAFRKARRRHTARIWHRDKSLAPEAKATLDALSKLSTAQRELLVLTALSSLSLAEIARMAGLPRSDAERELQTATSQFALSRDVPTTEVHRLLKDLAAPLEEVRWPRATVIRRNGATRRRTHTVIGAALATAALVASGSLVATGSDAEPTSLSEEKASPGITVHAPQVDTGQAIIDEASLLAPAQMGRFGSKLDWAETATTDNLAGDGLLAPCQRERFADPDSVAALARTWDGSTTRTVRRTVGRGDRQRTRKREVKRVESTAVQMVEMSRDADLAQQGFDAASVWYAGCTDPRTQLVSTRSVKRVGDDALAFRLRSWGKQPATISVGMARTGSLLVTNVVRTTGAAVSDKAALTGLAAAVNGLCGSEGAGTCAGRARARTTPPIDIGTPAGLLSVVDLPPVTAVRGPWVGTDPERAGSTNFASTRCDRTTFQGKGIRLAKTRTFLFPETRNVGQLGLTQVVGSMKDSAAKKFVEQVRTRILQCGRANLGTSVTQLANTSSKATDLSAWALSMELSDKQSFPFLMAIVRDGTAVSQLGFAPNRDMTMSRADFVALARRVLQRLAPLDKAGQGG